MTVVAVLLFPVLLYMLTVPVPAPQNTLPYLQSSPLGTWG